MISVEQAYELVLKNSSVLQERTVLLENTLGQLLSKDIFSPIDLPAFRNSAMDGYALNLEDLENGRGTLEQIDEIQAGDTRELILSLGKCMRIFTGAPVPKGANAVIMQENTTSIDNLITFDEPKPTDQMNIRQIGEQVRQGEVALKKNTKMKPATIGYLASLGITNIPVIPSPKVAIISTGNELVSPGKPISHGQIYESNSWALKAALYDTFSVKPSTINLSDAFEETKRQIASILNDHDLVLLSGGISVGDYDFVGKALRELDVEEVFYKVKQKPGKPLFMGKKDDTTIFALPGNPAAALTCFYVYVDPSIRIMKGLSPSPFFHDQLPALNSFEKKGPRAQFLKARIELDGVRILEGQSSNMMHTYAGANGLVYISEDQGRIAEGDLVSVCDL